LASKLVMKMLVGASSSRPAKEWFAVDLRYLHDAAEKAILQLLVVRQGDHVGFGEYFSEPTFPNEQRALFCLHGEPGRISSGIGGDVAPEFPVRHGPVQVPKRNAMEWGIKDGV
jgi:hypothetical protein